MNCLFVSPCNSGILFTDPATAAELANKEEVDSRSVFVGNVRPVSPCEAFMCANFYVMSDIDLCMCSRHFFPCRNNNNYYNTNDYNNNNINNNTKALFPKEYGWLQAYTDLVVILMSCSHGTFSPINFCMIPILQCFHALFTL